ncbi:hypothetical protein J8273_7115 [Carpediemonas membranifera]|uniref:Sister chromatid cohesion protein n=1 Tax=Carpediemonas membranifera TaxID=201153 RepID=A0A8J6AQ23_9EUKA|nr:hypothetical protein J8273_7115 [Carpediemonas membranifera]|eukprot:KAG9390856.1 hypothetical protein J8273_7115 [Carpediemonas membranifera]
MVTSGHEATSTVVDAITVIDELDFKCLNPSGIRSAQSSLQRVENYLTTEKVTATPEIHDRLADIYSRYKMLVDRLATDASSPQLTSSPKHQPVLELSEFASNQLLAIHLALDVSACAVTLADLCFREELASSVPDDLCHLAVLVFRHALTTVLAPSTNKDVSTSNAVIAGVSSRVALLLLGLAKVTPGMSESTTETLAYNLMSKDTLFRGDAPLADASFAAVKTLCSLREHVPTFSLEDMAQQLAHQVPMIAQGTKKGSITLLPQVKVRPLSFLALELYTASPPDTTPDTIHAHVKEVNRCLHTVVMAGLAHRSLVLELCEDLEAIVLVGPSFPGAIDALSCIIQTCHAVVNAALQGKTLPMESGDVKDALKTAVSAISRVALFICSQGPSLDALQPPREVSDGTQSQVMEGQQCVCGQWVDTDEEASQSRLSIVCDRCGRPMHAACVKAGQPPVACLYCYLEEHDLTPTLAPCAAFTDTAVNAARSVRYLALRMRHCQPAHSGAIELLAARALDATVQGDREATNPKLVPPSDAFIFRDARQCSTFSRSQASQPVEAPTPFTMTKMLHSVAWRHYLATHPLFARQTPKLAETLQKLLQPSRQDSAVGKATIRIDVFRTIKVMIQTGIAGQSQDLILILNECLRDAAATIREAALDLISTLDLGFVNQTVSISNLLFDLLVTDKAISVRRSAFSIAARVVRELPNEMGTYSLMNTLLTHTTDDEGVQRQQLIEIGGLLLDGPDTPVAVLEVLQRTLAVVKRGSDDQLSWKPMATSMSRALDRFPKTKRESPHAALDRMVRWACEVIEASCVTNPDAEVFIGKETELVGINQSVVGSLGILYLVSLVHPESVLPAVDTVAAIIAPKDPLSDDKRATFKRVDTLLGHARTVALAIAATIAPTINSLDQSGDLLDTLTTQALLLSDSCASSLLYAVSEFFAAVIPLPTAPVAARLFWHRNYIHFRQRGPNLHGNMLGMRYLFLASLPFVYAPIHRFLAPTELTGDDEASFDALDDLPEDNGDFPVHLARLILDCLDTPDLTRGEIINIHRALAAVSFALPPQHAVVNQARGIALQSKNVADAYPWIRAFSIYLRTYRARFLSGGSTEADNDAAHMQVDIYASHLPRLCRVVDNNVRREAIVSLVEATLLGDVFPRVAFPSLAVAESDANIAINGPAKAAVTYLLEKHSEECLRQFPKACLIAISTPTANFNLLYKRCRPTANTIAAIKERRAMLLSCLRVPMVSGIDPNAAAVYAGRVCRVLCAMHLETTDEVLVLIDAVNREVIPVVDATISPIFKRDSIDWSDPAVVSRVNKVMFAGFLLLLQRMLREKYHITKEKLAAYDPSAEKATAAKLGMVDMAPLTAFGEVIKTGDISAIGTRVHEILNADDNVYLSAVFKKQKQTKARAKTAMKRKAVERVQPKRGKRANNGDSDSDYVE